MPGADETGSSWRCPSCREPLELADERLACSSCPARYALVAGIPDLRLPRPAWIDFEEDRRRAAEVAGATGPDDAEAAVRFVLDRRPGWSAGRVDRLTQSILDAPGRLAAELDGWLAPLLQSAGPVLDVGCGPGQLLAALADRGGVAVGVDVSLEWLVVAQRMIRAHGGRPVLAAALGEALPLADASIGAVALLDVVEHVGDAAGLVTEVDRVLTAGGKLALATPNRFSLSAEPHVGIWGVGWLPRRYQAAYVRRRTGDPYAFAKLLGPRELARLLARNSRIDARVTAATVPSSELAGFSGRRATLARSYNALARRRLGGALVRPICPFFHVVGVKRAAAGSD